MDKGELLRLAEIEDALADMVLVKGEYMPKPEMRGTDLVTTAHNSRYRAKALRLLASKTRALAKEAS